MNRSSYYSTSRRRAMASVCTLIASVLVLAFAPSRAAYSAPDEVVRFRPGLCNSQSRPLTAKQLRTLLEGLRLKTGLMEMWFHENGVLKLGDRTHIGGGSATARALIFAAVDSLDSFRLENHQQSPTIAFAQIASTEDYVDAAEIKHVVWDLRFDFHDFTTLRGGAESLAAFDPAINLLHELGHSVLNLSDAVSQADPLGGCERHINQIRRELGLPERQSYTPQSKLAVTPGNTARSMQAELIFVRAESGKRESKIKMSSLSFDVERVQFLATATLQSGQRAEMVVAIR